VVGDYQSSLKPSTVQALICASSWIRGSQHEKTAPILVVCSPIFLLTFVFLMLMCHVWSIQEGDDSDIEFVEFPKGVVARN
jgi:hypothetical protein